MAHIKVVRRSMPLEQWARLQLERVDALTIAARYPTRNWSVRVGRYRPDGYAWDHPFRPVAEGELWGRPDGTAQFEAQVPVPPALEGRRVWLEFLTGAEVLVHNHGRLLDGIDPNRSLALLTNAAEPGDVFALMLEAYTRSVPDDMRNVKTCRYRGCVQEFHAPNLVVVDETALAAKHDLDVLYRAAFSDAVGDDLRRFFTYHLEETIRRFPLYDCSPDELADALPAIREYLAATVYREDAPFGHTGRLACVAHSHLDIAYHWKAAQTVQKNARTCLIQLRLMDRHPDFTYAHSQAWTYEMLERHYPELFREVKARIAEGRWEIVGGMYVEPDCNLPSAESLVRQVAYGKRYFLEAFGVEVNTCWLPDVFGNSAILPQILRAGRIDYFVSNKMSTWNDTNRFPHNNFIWRGIDGSDVMACVPPTHFITWHDPGQLAEAWDAFLDKETCEESLQMYGYGDGGSGVTEEMLEHYERVARLPGLPRLRMATAREYLEETFAPHREALAVWDGELYLEMHRGTFTSKASLKRRNRQGEFLLGETERLCVMAALRGRPYPVRELRAAWKQLLLNQFHDILPGSQTQPVYLEALETYAAFFRTTARLRDAALDVLAPSADDPRQVCVFNPFAFARPGAVAILADPPEEALEAEGIRWNDGSWRPLQTGRVAGGGMRLYAGLPALPPLGTTGGQLADDDPDAPTGNPTRCAELSSDPAQLENRFFRLMLDEDGNLVELYDKLRDRHVIPPGDVANQWQVFEDKPGSYNAWDIIRNYKDHPVPIPGWDAVDVVENGPLTCAVRLTRQFLASRAEQIIRLHADIPRIEFETWVDWRETEKLLKVAFPVSVKSRYFTTDTSAGGLERENHRNTTWQEARFEVCHHKWLDLSEGLFGIALMNDSRYGCDVTGNVMRLSLLRAPIRPDPVSDREEHRFTYALWTHDGDWRRGGVVEAAYDLNWPAVLLPGRAPAAETLPPPLTIDNPAVHLMALKGDEDEDGDVVARLVELYGSHAPVTVTAGFDFRQVFACDLLERESHELAAEGRNVSLDLAPYQLRTLRFVR